MPPRPATAVAAATAPRPPSRVATAARFYVRTLPPFALIVLQMFATYAVIAHVVPHVACRGQSNEAAFDQDGVSPFVRCVYNYDTDYSEHRGRKVGFLLLWTLSETWLGAYQILIARSMWPATARGKPVAAAAVLAAAAAALVAAAPVFRLPLDANHYIFALTWPVTQVILWCLAAPLVRATGDPTDAARYIATMVSAGAVVTVYLVLMARIVTRRALAKPVQLLLTRLVFHTAIWEGVTLIFTHFTRFVGATAPLATAPLYIWPLMYKSIYGRFLLATLDTAGSVAVLNLIMAFVGLAARVASRTPGAVRVKASYGATAAEAVEGDPAVASARAAKRALGGLAELCGVACTAAVYTFGRVSPDGVTAYAAKDIWVSALYQALTVLTFDGLGVAVDAGLHGLHDAAHWPRSRRALAKTLATIALLCLIGGGRIALEIVMLFCPTEGEGGAALLAFCNAPSIFDRL